ncbi:MAG: diguanylate cyclase, partial [Oscillospiraceae bacterium]
MIAWLAINIMYLLFNSAVMEDSAVQNQIIAPCVILAGAYIMLFFAIKTGKLLDYREKNEELELTISKEQEYRSSITRDAVLNYEFNLSSDVITSGFENARDELGDMIYRYSDMLSFSAHKFVHPDDVDDFAKYVSPSNIKKEFERGTRELTLSYRRRTSSGEYIWCRAITTLVRDAESGDIHGFTYVKNIDTEKRRQMELQYKAERDSLTGLYNKGVTGKLIAEHLVLNHSRISSALFMIDVDNFKDVNDHFGHAYGDTVLCELGEKLRAIFRADDIIGRIGGDEYIVYMKSAASDKAVREKGDEICEAFRTSYVDAQDEGFTLSSSVGVAIS